MTSMITHMKEKQHLICTSWGLPSKAFQFTRIMTSCPAIRPQIATEAPILIESNLHAAAKMLPKILLMK